MIDSLNGISDPKGSLLLEFLKQKQESSNRLSSQSKSEYVKKIHEFYNQR